MSLPILSVRIQYEPDVVACRQRARQVAEALGLETQYQTRLATAVSEISRNAFMYAGGGRADFSLEGTTTPQLLSVRISDSGPGIENLNDVLEGRYYSQTGLGLGMAGAKRLMDSFTVKCEPGRGTEVVLGKLLPRRAPLVTAETLPQLVAKLERQAPRDLLSEFREQNRELMRTLDELRKRQNELQNLNRELEDTNRGVVALYAELDEKADHLRRADDVKSRFLSNMSHEFRTPLSSILALSRLLSDHADGDLTSEQEIQVTYIRKSAESLFELVNDLLDLAKVEAGKTVVRPVEFEVDSLFGALRGMLRPLLVSSSLNLVFDDAGNCPPVYSDEGKVSQILRNFISNSLKFTEAGEVTVSVECTTDGRFISFHVRDTGIGIAPEDQETIFLEYAQLDNPLQRRVKGTGLGLPLSRRLAELLGGSVGVVSEPGIGSVFSLRLPTAYLPPQPSQPIALVNDSSRSPILLVEDQVETRLLYTQYLQNSEWQIVSARSTKEAHDALLTVTPVAILLDILLEGEDSWDLLVWLKSNDQRRRIPVIVTTQVEDRAKALALGADLFLLKPVDRSTLLTSLTGWATSKQRKDVLVVDDEEVARYFYKQLFKDGGVRLLEAASGADALELAAAHKPALIIMDLNMPLLDGSSPAAKLLSHPELKNIPVLVCTSARRSDERLRMLAGKVLAILPKETLSCKDAREKMLSILHSAGLGDLIVGSSANPEDSTR